MEPIGRGEIRDPAGYEKVRSEIRRRAIEQRAARHIGLGKKLSIVFESRDALAYQVQESLRAQRTVDELEIQREIEAVNELVPEEGTLAATLFLEVADGEPLAGPALEPLDLADGTGIWIEVGGVARIVARVEDELTSGSLTRGPVRLRFVFTPEEAAALRDATLPAALVVDLPGSAERADLSEAVRRTLAGDLGKG